MKAGLFEPFAAPSRHTGTKPKPNKGIVPMILKASAFAALMMALPLVPVHAANQTYVMQKDIAAKPGGYMVKVGKDKQFKILSVKPRIGKTSECRVHIPSIVREVERKLSSGGGKTGMTIKVEIQARISSDTNHTVFCEGGGTGCEVTLQIPPASGVWD